MFKSRTYALLCTSLLAMTSMAVADTHAAKSLSEFKAAIRTKYDLQEQAYMHKDAATAASNLYTEDATAAGGGDGGTVEGRAQLVELIKRHMDATIHIRSYRTRLEGDTGLDWANYHVTPDDHAKPAYTMKVLYVWQKRQGKWIVIGNMMAPGEFPEAAEAAH